LPAGPSERGDYVQAGKALYNQVLQQDPGNTERTLGQIESLISASKQLPAARQQLTQFSPVAGTRVECFPASGAWPMPGRRRRARQSSAPCSLELLQSSQAEPVVYRDAARLMPTKEPQQALDYYAKSMAGAGLISPEQASPRDNRAMTLASRAKTMTSGWPSSLRSDVDELYQRQTRPCICIPTMAGAPTTLPGTSDTDTRTTILQLDLPVAGWHRVGCVQNS
jgi:cellulose synthase operon protein C